MGLDPIVEHCSNPGDVGNASYLDDFCIGIDYSVDERQVFKE